ncbi:MAG: ubiquitin-like small modifier protein 1 [Candidatus Bathyarchaeia archaeon]
MLECGVKIKVRFFTTLREIVGKKEEELILQPNATLEDVFNSLSRKYGSRFTDYTLDEGAIKPFLQVLINGRNANLLDGMATHLNEGDTIAIIPPVGGG